LDNSHPLTPLNYFHFLFGFAVQFLALLFSGNPLFFLPQQISCLNVLGFWGFSFFLFCDPITPQSLLLPFSRQVCLRVRSCSLIPDSLPNPIPPLDCFFLFLIRVIHDTPIVIGFNLFYSPPRESCSPIASPPSFFFVPVVCEPFSIPFSLFYCLPLGSPASLFFYPPHIRSALESIPQCFLLYFPLFTFLPSLNHRICSWIAPFCYYFF